MLPYLALVLLVILFCIIAYRVGYNDGKQAGMNNKKEQYKEI